MKDEGEYEEEQTRQKHDEKDRKILLEEEHVAQRELLTAEIRLVHHVKEFAARLIRMTLERVALLDRLMHLQALDQLAIALEEILADVELHHVGRQEQQIERHQHVTVEL